MYSWTSTLILAEKHPGKRYGCQKVATVIGLETTNTYVPKFVHICMYMNCIQLCKSFDMQV